jgi:hypothetical protein
LSTVAPESRSAVPPSLRKSRGFSEALGCTRRARGWGSHERVPE